ncbi:tetratricopeptide repeat protein [Paracidobacterium acidisoli]|nr:tetratricopeptide repeat protein [Paracidobacterium acidisoli]MBT9329989.1 tetratricopeptide repeat protein [Paracidobacterium acidisoli]
MSPLPANSAHTPALSPEERLDKRRLILRDTASLASLFAITAVLFVITWFFFRSFEHHREELAQRWLTRGQTEMQKGHPVQAVYALRSALAYSPGRRDMEIQLATALAAAGRTQEAIAYFSNLHDAAPGDGIINLQLARLAAKQKNSGAETQRDYEAALDGTWQGDGYTRRREVRLEMAAWLIGRHDFDRARTQLLVAAGNAPDDPAIKLQIAGLLEQAQDPESALRIYSAVARRKPVSLDALEGAGRTAFEISRYETARLWLERVTGHPEFSTRPEAERSANQDMLNISVRLLNLYPGPGLNMRPRAERVLYAKKTASARMAACAAAQPQNALALADLTTRWHQLPASPKPLQLEQQPELEESVMQLVFDTERATAGLCGAPAGDDALLLRMAQIPVAHDQD